MPRANRHFVPGLVWHLTHRCHKKDFLLKFARDRRRWRYWLFEARRRHGLCVLDYIATSNHIHLLVRDRGHGEIARAMQLIAARTGQEFNRRKGRKGAFWEDRYHATAVESGSHLRRCMVYIDLNMVRAGVAKHPAQWEISGYHEIQYSPARYRVVDRQALAEALGYRDTERLADHHRSWVEEALHSSDGLDGMAHDARWTQSLAIGSETFVKRVHTQLGTRGRARRVEAGDDAWRLGEVQIAYGAENQWQIPPLRSIKRL